MQLPIRSCTPTDYAALHPQQAKLSLPHRPSSTSNMSSSRTSAGLGPLSMHFHTRPKPKSIASQSQSQPQALPHGTPVYTVRALEGWRQTPDSPVMKVDILGVFVDVEVANECTRKWLKNKLPGSCYRYGEGEVVKADGGIQVDLLTEKMDGSLLVDVERHFVKG